MSDFIKTSGQLQGEDDSFCPKCGTLTETAVDYTNQNEENSEQEEVVKDLASAVSTETDNDEESEQTLSEEDNSESNKPKSKKKKIIVGLLLIVLLGAVAGGLAFWDISTLSEGEFINIYNNSSLKGDPVDENSNIEIKKLETPVATPYKGIMKDYIVYYRTESGKLGVVSIASKAKYLYTGGHSGDKMYLELALVILEYFDSQYYEEQGGDITSSVVENRYIIQQYIEDCLLGGIYGEDIMPMWIAQMCDFAQNANPNLKWRPVYDIILNYISAQVEQYNKELGQEYKIILWDDDYKPVYTLTIGEPETTWNPELPLDEEDFEILESSDPEKAVSMIRKYGSKYVTTVKKTISKFDDLNGETHTINSSGALNLRDKLDRDYDCFMSKYDYDQAHEILGFIY